MNGLIKSPPEQPPLSNRNAYTTWPGGVDPTVPLYNTDNQKFGGGARRRRRNTRKTRKSRRNNVNRKVNRKARRASRKSRRASRKSRRASRRSRHSRRIRGGYATCAPIESGSPSIPMTASVCPEGYFEDKPVLIA